MNRFTHNKPLDPLFEKKIFQYVWNSVKLGRIQKRLLVIISSSTTATVPLNRCHDDAVVESGDRFSPTRCRADLRSAVVFLLLPLFLPSFSFPWMIFHEPTCCWSFFLFTKWFLPRLFCRRIERGTLLTRHRVDLRLCVLFLFFFNVSSSDLSSSPGAVVGAPLTAGLYRVLPSFFSPFTVHSGRSWKETSLLRRWVHHLVDKGTLASWLDVDLPYSVLPLPCFTVFYRVFRSRSVTYSDTRKPFEEIFLGNGSSLRF